MKFIKGVRFAPRNLMVHEPRSVEQQIEDVRREGMLLTPEMLRNHIVRGLEISHKRKSADNVVIIGCASFGIMLALKRYFELLERLGVEYTTLRKEYCCGWPLVQHQLVFEGGRDKGDEAAREFLGLNMQLAKEREAKNMVYFCTWCAYMAKRLCPQEEGLSHLFYADVLLPLVEGCSLRVSTTRVGYFSGRPHRWPMLVPEEDFDLNWQGYRRMLGRIEGLDVVDIPHYCCITADNLIWDKARMERLDTIITSCTACYSRLLNRAPEGIRIRLISDVIMEALCSLDKSDI